MSAPATESSSTSTTAESSLSPLYHLRYNDAIEELTCSISGETIERKAIIISASDNKDGKKSSVQHVSRFIESAKKEDGLRVAGLENLKPEDQRLLRFAFTDRVTFISATTSLEPEQTCTPWSAHTTSATGFDYDKLIDKFGSQRITPDLIERIERITGKRAHHWLRRGLFFSHRDLNLLLDEYEKGNKFYLYTGRGPSSDALHLGHLIPFMFTKYLQEAFGCNLVIQMTDDEKFYFQKKNLSLQEIHALTRKNVHDILACGYEKEKTFVFSDLEYVGTMYPNICRISKSFTYNSVSSCFGFTESDSCGKLSFPAIQAAPSFSNSFPAIYGTRSDVPCLIPCAIDQDPYFRLTRDCAPKLGYRKPSLIHAKFFPALQGAKSKMSSSDENSAVFVTDTPEKIAKKINKYAFSGGQQTVQEHREKGGNTEIDVAYQWLTFFEPDDEKLEEIRVEYSSGRMLASEIKKILIDTITPIVLEHQERKSKITAEMIEGFMTPRPLAG